MVLACKQMRISIKGSLAKNNWDFISFADMLS